MHMSYSIDLLVSLRRRVARMFLVREKIRSGSSDVAGTE